MTVHDFDNKQIILILGSNHIYP